MADIDISQAEADALMAMDKHRVDDTIILLRLDLDGPPHRNPDGKEIPCPHLHVYREGYGDKWATPAPTSWYADTSDLTSTLEEFMAHCNITTRPNIQRGLFS
jgi:hypothetical protein